MAIVKQLILHGDRWTTTLKYITNPEKTTEAAAMLHGFHNPFWISHSPAELEAELQKVERWSRYIATIGISSYENAARQFRTLWKRFGQKETGRMGYHIIQSFHPNDPVTPELALDLGRQLIQQTMPGHMAVIATHLDRRHLHNHMLVNVVNSRTGRKHHVHRFHERVLIPACNKQCREHGLSVIEPDRNRTRHYVCGDYALPARLDLSYAQQHTASTEEMVRMLESFGHKVWFEEDRVFLKPPGAKKAYYFNSKEASRQRRSARAFKLKDPSRHLKDKSVKLTPFAAKRLLYACLLGQQRLNRKEWIAFSEYRLRYRHLDAACYLAKAGFETLARVVRERRRVQSERQSCEDSIKNLRRQESQFSRIFKAESILTFPREHTEDELEEARQILKKAHLDLQEARRRRMAVGLSIDRALRRQRELRGQNKLLDTILSTQRQMEMTLDRASQEREQLQPERRRHEGSIHAGRKAMPLQREQTKNDIQMRHSCKSTDAATPSNGQQRRSWRERLQETQMKRRSKKQKNNRRPKLRYKDYER